MNNYDMEILIAAAKSGEAKDLLSKLSLSDAAKIKNILANRQLTEQLMNSPEAQKIIKNIMGDKK